MNMLFLMNKTKDQISWVLSHDLYWENKMYKRKRSIPPQNHSTGLSAPFQLISKSNSSPQRTLQALEF